MIKEKEKHTVKIIDEDNRGNGIAKIEDFVVFVPHTLIEEECEIEITDIKKRYALSKVLNIKKTSIKRREIECSSFKECGGCDYLHLSYLDEIEKKKNQINKLFNMPLDEFISTTEKHYRNKAIFHVHNSKIGFYEKNTNSVVEFDKCLLLSERINEIYTYLKKLDLSKVNQIQINESNDLIMLSVTGELKKSDIEKLLSENRIESLYLNEKLAFGDSCITEKIGLYSFKIHPNSFFQVNKYNVKLMYDKIKAYAKTGESLLDLYCGTGTIGIYLSNNFKKVTGVEINPFSIENAKVNKQINEIKNIKFIKGDSNLIKDGKYDVVIVDPPRSGLDKKVVTNIRNIKPKTLIYVSCNEITLKRDIKYLEDIYEIKNISLVDMFSRTNNIETIMVLKQKKKNN